jgi:hypothetical protein
MDGGLSEPRFKWDEDVINLYWKHITQNHYSCHPANISWSQTHSTHFNPKNGGSKFPRNVDTYLTNYMVDFRFSQWWRWRVLSSGMRRRVVRHKFADVSEEHTASILYQMEAIHFSETLVNSHQTTRRYMREDGSRTLNEM